MSLVIFPRNVAHATKRTRSTIEIGHWRQETPTATGCTCFKPEPPHEWIFYASVYMHLMHEFYYFTDTENCR